MKFSRRIIAGFSFVALIIFIPLLVQLFDRGEIEYTDEVVQKVPKLLNIDPMIGATGPQVIIVYYADFACEQCVVTSKILNAVIKDYPDEVILAWKDFPNDSLNPESTRAAIAARCAQEQHHFWDYQEILTSHQNDLGDNLYTAIAEELNLGMWRFNRCLRKESTLDWVEESAQDAKNLNLTAAPTIFINGMSYTGTVSEAKIRSQINQILAQ